MPFIVYIAPFIPFLAMLPPSLAAVWIANRWLKTRRANAELETEVAALRDEVAAVRQEHGELQERFELAERMLSQVRASRELPR